MEPQAFCTLTKVDKAINSLFSSKEVVCVGIKLWPKLSKIAIREARHFWEAAHFGLIQFRVKAIYQLTPQRISLQTGPKLYLVIVMEHYTRAPLNLP